MRWLITGGCGFIGRNLISTLLKEGGHSIRVLDNLKVGSRQDLGMVCDFSETAVADLDGSQPAPGIVELVVGDILDAELALQVCREADVIVHLAANTGVAPSVENPRMDCEANVFGTLNYLEAARHCNVKRFVFASSGAPAGEVEPPIHEELPPHPVSPYGASKLAGEGYCSAYFRTFGVETVCLRFGNVYGPLSGKKDSVVAKFIKRAIEGRPLEIYGDGKQTRDFIYIDDLIRSIRLAASAESAGGETFQIATNQETTVGELVEKLVPVLERFGVTGTKVAYGERRQGDVMRNFSDTTKAREVLGWECQENLDSGLEKTVKWFLD
jgi:UDP-glucose 4-epimerase